jgi:hypothetical protein
MYKLEQHPCPYTQDTSYKFARLSPLTNVQVSKLSKVEPILLFYVNFINNIFKAIT